ncbi:MAG: hypothetical protein ACXADX_20955 [Candidatus Hodarchaeales archaeon]|jgi:hypothetical protein
MDTLTKAGILDLGGVGEHALEIEYNSKDQFHEAFYRLPESCKEQPWWAGLLSHEESCSILTIKFVGSKIFYIPLPHICDELIEVRLPLNFGGKNITASIVCK